MPITVEASTSNLIFSDLDLPGGFHFGCVPAAGLEQRASLGVGGVMGVLFSADTD